MTAQARGSTGSIACAPSAAAMPNGPLPRCAIWSPSTEAKTAGTAEGLSADARGDALNSARAAVYRHSPSSDMGPLRRDKGGGNGGAPAPARGGGGDDVLSSARATTHHHPSPPNMWPLHRGKGAGDGRGPQCQRKGTVGAARSTTRAAPLATTCHHAIWDPCAFVSRQGAAVLIRSTGRALPHAATQMVKSCPATVSNGVQLIRICFHRT